MSTPITRSGIEKLRERVRRLEGAARIKKIRIAGVPSLFVLELILARSPA
jgi:hypothetical protein